MNTNQTHHRSIGFDPCLACQETPMVQTNLDVLNDLCIIIQVDAGILHTILEHLERGTYKTVSPLRAVLMCL